MSTFVGYDYDGRPLKSGDTVIRVNEYPDGASHIGAVHKIIGICPIDGIGAMEIDVPHPSIIWKWWSVKTNDFRKVKTLDIGNWSEIERETGWSPKIEAEA